MEFNGSIKLMSDEELKKCRDMKENALKNFICSEYKRYQQYINYYHFPEINSIEIVKIPGIDARVMFFSDNKFNIQVNSNFTKSISLKYLEVVLFHEFTHVWDKVVGYGSTHTKLSEYHAVQVAFAKNINQVDPNKWSMFSAKDLVWYNEQNIASESYLMKWNQYYSYRMEYNYYNESPDRTAQYMYDLCQWFGYSVLFEKYCIEWHGERKLKAFIPRELENEIEQFYISLRDNHHINHIESNYKRVASKFYYLNRFSFSDNENYFISEKIHKLNSAISFKEHCLSIDHIYNQMYELHPKKIHTNLPYLNKSFALGYFKTMYSNLIILSECNDLLQPFQTYMKQFILNCPEDYEDLLKALIHIKQIFETPRYFDVVIDQIKKLHTVKTCKSENDKEYYYIENIQIFIDEMGFTAPFLAALLMGISDAGYSLSFSDGMIISKS